MDNKPTTLSDEEAKKLGFVPPKPQQPNQPQHQDMTNVLGYFNPHSWPIHVSLSEVGLSCTLDKRGQFLVDSEGRRINDPRLDKLVSEYGLAKEMTTESVPTVWIKPAQEQNDSPYGFRGGEIVKDSKGAAVPPQRADAKDAPSRPTGGRTPVGSMTIEEARRLGLAKGNPMPDDVGAPETDGAPAGGNIPDLRVPNPNAVYRNPDLEKQNNVSESLDPDADDVMSGVLTEAQKQVQARQQQEAQPEEVPDTSPQPVEPTKPAPEDNLPAPDLDDDEVEVEDLEKDAPAAEKAPPSKKVAKKATTEKVVSKSSDKKYVDPDTGRAFKYRSELKRFCEKSHGTERTEEILKAYPQTERGKRVSKRRSKKK